MKRTINRTATIRELFHELGNWHNKISIGAGVTKEAFKRECANKSLNNSMLIEELERLEKLAIGADKVLRKLKDEVYKRINPDTGTPNTEG